MAKEDKEDAWSALEDSPRRFFAFAVPLSLLSSLVTLGIAYWSSPNHELNGIGYVAWLSMPIFAFVAFVGQNTIEGCVILVFLGVGLGIGSRFLPLHLLYPGVSVLIAPWVLTRVHRRFCDRKPWIE